MLHLYRFLFCADGNGGAIVKITVPDFIQTAIISTIPLNAMAIDYINTRVCWGRWTGECKNTFLLLMVWFICHMFELVLCHTERIHDQIITKGD